MCIQPSWHNRIPVKCTEILYYKNDTLWFIIQDFLETQDINTDHQKAACFINEEKAFWNAPYNICILH